MDKNAIIQKINEFEEISKKDWEELKGLVEKAFKTNDKEKRLYLLTRAELIEQDLTGDCKSIGPYIEANYSEDQADLIDDIIRIEDCSNCDIEKLTFCNHHSSRGWWNNAIEAIKKKGKG